MKKTEILLLLLSAPVAAYSASPQLIQPPFPTSYAEVLPFRQPQTFRAPLFMKQAFAFVSRARYNRNCFRADSIFGTTRIRSHRQAAEIFANFHSYGSSSTGPRRLIGQQGLASSNSWAGRSIRGKLSSSPSSLQKPTVGSSAIHMFLSTDAPQSGDGGHRATGTGLEENEPGTKDANDFQWDDVPEGDGKKWSKYENLVRRLYMTNLFNPVKLGLENMDDLHKAFGSPMDQPNINVIHIAGSNGKGSVALKTASVLQLAGHRVGLFVSPHISSFRERMQINGVPITEEQVERYLPEIYRLCEERGIPATFFEITTALAFSFFANENVTSVVLETGLGGRLDATNVVKRPALSIITSIGLEHTRILGDTIELIALEKGGIIKAGCPVLVGNNAPYDVLRHCAEEKGASGFYSCNDVLGEEREAASTVNTDGGKIKDYDDENSRITTAAISLLQRGQVSDLDGKIDRKCHLPILPEHVSKGIAIRPPCRFEEIGVTVAAKDSDGHSKEKQVTVILDIAHNPQAMENLVAKLNTTYPTSKKRIVVGMSADKDLGQCTDVILSHVPNPRSIHLVEACHPRAASIKAILAANPKLLESRFRGGDGDASVASQVRSAIELAAVEGEMVVVCGSVFIMADAREELGIVEPRDSAVISEVAGAGLRSSQENFARSSPTNTK